MFSCRQLNNGSACKTNFSIVTPGIFDYMRLMHQHPPAKVRPRMNFVLEK